MNEPGGLLCFQPDPLPSPAIAWDLVVNDRRALGATHPAGRSIRPEPRAQLAPVSPPTFAEGMIPRIVPGETRPARETGHRSP